MSDSLQEMVEKAKSRAIDVESDISYRGIKSRLKDGEIKEVSQKDKLIWAALGGLLGLGGSIITPKIIPALAKALPKGRFPFPVTAAITGSSASLGYFSPDMQNLAMRDKAGLISSEEAEDINRSYGRIQHGITDRVYRSPLSNIDNDSIEKSASTFLGTVASGLVTGTKKTSKALWHGLKYSPQKRTLPGTAWSYAVKGGAAGGAIYGAHRARKSLYKKRSGSNYTTFLRNNVLAGHVQPSELSRSDMVSVKKLGMN